ncbi:MAG TPA: Rpn family recombination-promoting nuclease/putative transposase [Candidatus Scybalomonas excrementigallinarum]|nr:Rpn family recombination-promoting nuclease/putative transposase [Candidatus Scybalomonas excrementigallinarum]
MGQSNEFKEEYLERLKKFRLMDDDFMSKCFEDNIECTELVVQIVLERQDLKIEQVHAQHQIKNLQGRSIILDIYAMDSTGKRYNIEIQRADKGAVTKRARYHSSVIDSNTIMAKEEYDQLPETYVIFITEHDVLKKNLPIYHIERVIQETGEYFGDEAHIIYVNGAYQDDTPLGILMKDFSCTRPEDMYYKPLLERVKYFKENREGVATMCKMMEDMRKEAAEEAAKKAAEETATKLLRSEDMSYEKISEYSNLPLKEVEKLAKEMGL